MEKENYRKFALMMIVSYVIMYGVMFTNAAEFGHIRLS